MENCHRERGERERVFCVVPANPHPMPLVYDARVCDAYHIGPVPWCCCLGLSFAASHIQRDALRDRLVTRLSAFDARASSQGQMTSQ